MMHRIYTQIHCKKTKIVHRKTEDPPTGADIIIAEQDLQNSSVGL